MPFKTWFSFPLNQESNQFDRLLKIALAANSPPIAVCNKFLPSKKRVLMSIVALFNPFSLLIAGFCLYQSYDLSETIISSIGDPLEIKSLSTICSLLYGKLIE